MVVETIMLFPQGKPKALTLSYDDGVEQDIKLIEIMKKYGIKGTFNLNSKLFAKEGTVYPEGQVHRRMTLSRAKELYTDSGNEVAVHCATHPRMAFQPTATNMYEVISDRIVLEKEFDQFVRGMAYPFGRHIETDDMLEMLRMSGIAYARTVAYTEDFKLPENWLKLEATCHHNNPNLMKLADRFVNETPKIDDNPWLFYLWGHSYEFEGNDNWNVIEDFCEKVSGKDDIWYATNIEIYDYINAYKQLQFTVEMDRVYNPTALEIWFTFDRKPFSIKPGETIKLR